MQTFLPYPSFERSAKVLDYRRLGKQRVEAWQIYLALFDPDYGWQNHPAVKMWRGYELALAWYGLYMCDEWKYRGYKDTMSDKFHKVIEAYPGDATRFFYAVPPWVGNRKFHKSHKSNLLRKDKAYYSKFFKNVPDNLPYEWPVQ